MTPTENMLFERALRDLMRRFNADEGDVVETLFDNRKVSEGSINTIVGTLLEHQPVQFYEYVLADLKEFIYNDHQTHYHLIHFAEGLEGQLSSNPESNGMTERLKALYNPDELKEIMEGEPEHEE
jgi:hypothetical protein